MAEASVRSFQTDLYVKQRNLWPESGSHILAQYDEETVIVYQAFKPSIAKYAVENQCFGGPDFSFERMSWIKTNFLWMMYRCGWASKKNQERVLAVRITRSGFDEILSKAYLPWLQKSKNIDTKDIEVRLQWDPDHLPNYNKSARRAIQLGMKGEVLKKYGTQWIVNIEDITKFVTEQKEILDKEGDSKILTAKECVYPVKDDRTAQRIVLDFYDHQGPTVVDTGS